MARLLSDVNNTERGRLRRAKALNLGAYDVLAQPFDGMEVSRIVNLARLRWEGRHGIRGGAPRARGMTVESTVAVAWRGARHTGGKTRIGRSAAGATSRS